jgi:hypothetical protein
MISMSLVHVDYLHGPILFFARKQASLSSSMNFIQLESRFVLFRRVYSQSPDFRVSTKKTS